MEYCIIVTLICILVYIFYRDYRHHVKVLNWSNKQYIYRWASMGIVIISLWLIGKIFSFEPKKNIKTALFVLLLVLISIYCERFIIKKNTIKVNLKSSYIIDNDINRINIAKRLFEDYTIKISLEPQNFNLYLERAKIYESLKKYDLAVQDLTIAIELKPQNSYFYYYLRHKQYIFLGDLEKALEDIIQAVNLAPHGYNYHRNLADVYEKLGQRDNAIMALNQGVEREPGRYAYLERAKFYQRIGCLEEALKDVTQAINIDPKYMMTFHDRIIIYIKMEQFDNALADCKKCIEIEPTEWTHFRLLSEVYKAMGNNNAAESYYRYSVDLNPCINR